MLRKSMMLVLVIAALISVGLFAVSAQTDDPQPTPMCMGANSMFGMGMMMGGHGMMLDDDHAMLTVAAEALGMDVTTLTDALQGGQTLTEIAEAQGVELQTVLDAMLTGAEAHMAEMVAAGFITQEQADEHLNWMHENSATMPMFSGAGIGSCMQGMMSNGMHGHGMRHHR